MFFSQLWKNVHTGGGRSWAKLYKIRKIFANFFFEIYAQKKSEFCKQNSKEYYLHK